MLLHGKDCCKSRHTWWEVSDIISMSPHLHQLENGCTPRVRQRGRDKGREVYNFEVFSTTKLITHRMWGIWWQLLVHEVVIRYQYDSVWDEEGERGESEKGEQCVEWWGSGEGVLLWGGGGVNGWRIYSSRQSNWVSVCVRGKLDVVEIFWNSKLFIEFVFFHSKPVLAPRFHRKHILSPSISRLLCHWRLLTCTQPAAGSSGRCVCICVVYTYMYT